MTQTSNISRTRFTWLAYVMLGFYAYMQAVLGPLMPFLREELDLSYTLAGLHFSAFALGMILSGSSGERVAGWLGRRRLFWWGGLGMSLGGLILAFGQAAPLTILGAFVMGLVGTYLLVLVQALLSDEFGDQRAVALTEANLIAIVFAALAPLAVAVGPSFGLDWRLALWLGGGFFFIACLTQYRVSLPPARPVASETGAPADSNLSPVFRLYWLVIFVGVAIEWCMIFWLADFLTTVADVPATSASSLVSVFLGAMIVGRMVGSRLTRRLPVIGLLLGMALIILLGFPLFWLGHDLILRIVGLVIIGLGLSNLFPLGLSAASDAGANNVDKASARVSQAAGLAILIAPQTLGTLADRWGILRAYGVLPVLLSILIVMVAYAYILDNRQHKP